MGYCLQSRHGVSAKSLMWSQSQHPAEVFPGYSARDAAAALDGDHRNLVAVSLEKIHVGRNVEDFQIEGALKRELVKQLFGVFAQVAARTRIETNPEYRHSHLPEADEQVYEEYQGGDL
ncbi:MAG: hypothetical protein JWO59_1992 [Chloroflexi bacterium]|nr:hypothetical protein [Chloroflexota bacterium]MDB5075640.1 hypothetical protein [Chloroflexota bacterium]